jgi:hypothetical protein
LLTFLFLTVL